MGDIALGAGEEIIDADDFMALADQPVAQMRTQKARTSGDKNVLPALIRTFHLPGFPHASARLYQGSIALASCCRVSAGPLDLPHFCHPNGRAWTLSLQSG